MHVCFFREEQKAYSALVWGSHFLVLSAKFLACSQLIPTRTTTYIGRGEVVLHSVPTVLDSFTDSTSNCPFSLKTN